MICAARLLFVVRLVPGHGVEPVLPVAPVAVVAEAACSVSIRIPGSPAKRHGRRSLETRRVEFRPETRCLSNARSGQSAFRSLPAGRPRPPSGERVHARATKRATREVLFLSPERHRR